MGAETSPTAAPSRRLLWVILAALGGLLVIALVVVLVVWRGGAATPTAAGDPTATRPTPTASADPVPLAAAATTTGPRPTTCDAIYSPEMLTTFSETRTLNPAWTVASDAVLQAGSTDEELIALIQGTDHLTCIWASEGGPSDSGLTTNVSYVTPEQSEAAYQRLLALGQSCYEELDGIRCVMQTEPDSDGSAGESHFLRDGIWLATHYVNAGPDGYTHDMVNTIWADA
ncbi:hypothetical protein K2F54_17665 [Cryobacterium sp. 1639]|uniref:hypothetical protein n=1 Tax=Cryobacterium inferilacus TaxID=2866629 RepID=UPI001C736C96|nr:hypothetical protein [Cryobacterium sp. 1639]MBX0301795.1 hypothetical protein [Cryobacterium sp. 1639]